MVECDAKLSGNLFKAEGNVEVIAAEMPIADGLLAIETYYTEPLGAVDWGKVDALIVGGETSGLPRKIAADHKATIPMVGSISGLTVEAALAIALYEWSHH